MKIICFSNIDGKVKMVLKGDSSLLVNHKPFFIPDWSNNVQMTPSVALRVSRLGKSIDARFANRYYDAVALALNIYALDWLEQGDYIRGVAFDYSLPLGKWINISDNPWNDLIITMDEAVAQASQVMTIRQGDIIVIDRNIAPRKLDKEEVLDIRNNENELLYCKIR